MPKKSRQMASTYAKQSAKSKKKRSQKPRAQERVTSVSQEETVIAPAPNQINYPSTAGKKSTVAGITSPTYPYVISDLKRTAIIGLAMFIILIVLSFIL